MDRWQAAGLAFAVASAVIGTIGLVNSKPLPHSARLGALAPLDVNNDGRLSANEWRHAGRDPAQMQAMDSNNNGFVEPDEIQPKRAGGGGE